MLHKILELKGVESLSKRSQKTIVGGTIRCTCGFEGQGMPTYIEGATILEALGFMSQICNGQGAQCSGVSLAGE